MSLLTYNLLHVIGILMLFVGIGGAIIRSVSASESKSLEKLVLMNHGIGLFLILIAGFGQLAKIGMQFSTWVVVKIIIWLLMGSLIMFIKKKPELKTLWWYGALVMGGFAAYLGIFKPF